MTYVHPVFPVLVLLILLTAWPGASKRWRRAPFFMALALSLWAWSPTAWLTSRSLEWPYWPPARPTDGYDAIVVLSESIYPVDISQPEPSIGIGTYLRCRHAAWLYRQGKSVPVVATGGGGAKGLVIARMMAAALQREGVPAQMIWTEERSASTYENAVFSAELLRARGIGRIALVTEAYHMIRAEKCFRKQGLTVVPAPTVFRSHGFGWKPLEFIPGDRMMRLNDDALHEWVGLGWYWISGKI
jgi:uncharacterized SAM-binding protein YcdF (DUF218 family)